MIYFDYTATTPIDEEVLNTYIKTQKNFFANTSSLHKLGQMSNFMLDKATSELKAILGVRNHKIIYTTNATEANNLGIFGIVEKYEHGKIITSKIEHPSVFEVFKYLETKGYEVVYLDVDSNGVVNLEQLQKEMNKDVILVSIMWVNNIIGSIQPIRQIIDIVKPYNKAKLHVDAVQGLCKINPDFDFSNIDLITISGHKIYAPKGVAALLVKDGIELEKRLYGSNAQYGIKPGTIDLALIVSLVKAIKKYYPLISSHYEYVTSLNQYLREGVKKLDKIIINSPKTGSPYIFNISIPSIQGETILHKLEEADIYVSTGSACSSKLKKPEKTVYAISKSQELATSTIRISLSHLTTKAEIDKLIEILESL